MSRTCKAVLSLLLMAAAVLTWSTPGSAQPGGAGVSSIHKPTNVKAHPTWIRFQPTLTGEHLVLGDRSAVTTICWAQEPGGPRWDVVYDHYLQIAGWTHSNNIHPGADVPCSSAGIETDLIFPEAWVHLARHADWAYQVVEGNHNIRTFCFSTANSYNWDLIIDLFDNTVGFADRSALDSRKRSTENCS